MSHAPEKGRRSEYSRAEIRRLRAQLRKKIARIHELEKQLGRYQQRITTKWLQKTEAASQNSADWFSSNSN